MTWDDSLIPFLGSACAVPACGRRGPAFLAIVGLAVAGAGCSGGGYGGSVGAIIEVDRTPAGIAAGEGAIWVSQANGDSLLRIDPSSNEVVAEIPVGDGPEGVTVGGGSVWVVNQGEGTLSRIDPGSDTVVDTVRLAEPPSQSEIEEALGVPDRSFLEGFDAVSFGERAVWAAGSDGLARIDPGSLEVATWTAEDLQLGQVAGGVAEPGDAAAGGGRVWLSVPVPTAVFGFDPATGRSERRTGGGKAVAVGEDAVWSVDTIGGSVIRSELGGESWDYDEIEVGEDPDDIVVGEGAVWVSLSDGTLARIDPASGDVEGRIDLLPDGEGQDDLALQVTEGEGAVWVADRTGDRVFRVDP